MTGPASTDVISLNCNVPVVQKSKTDAECSRDITRVKIKMLEILFGFNVARYGLQRKDIDKRKENCKKVL